MVVSVWADQELCFPGVPLISIIHVSEGLIATQPMFSYRQARRSESSLFKRYERK